MQRTDKTALAERLARLSPDRLELLFRTLEARALAPARPAFEPIAIIGAACRFPGGADSTASYWRLLCDETCAVGEIPPTRWDANAYYDRNVEAPGKMYTRHGGFLADIERADFRFFNIDPREARTLDPHQSLLLEVAWEALEDAGVPADGLAGSRTGVFLAIAGSDHGRQLLQQEGPRVLDDSFATGTMSSMAAGRLSYILGLHGPSMVLDTACSSSLVALHLACRSLQDEECELALVGGVHLLLAPEMYIALCRAQALAPDGRCKSFDAAADGYVRGEGCGVVVLKRLAAAQADGDHLLAVVRGTAINQDGRGNGMRAPNGLAQEMVMRQALGRAGVDPAHIAYVEAHGTASLLGDAIELTALGNVLTPADAAAAPCGIGSVKGNIGHLEIASGMASLIKAALILAHREVPATLHVTQPNPQVDWSRSRLRVHTKRAPLPDDNRPALVGINSFGWAGTNAFVVLEEAPQPARELSPRLAEAGVLTLSARSMPALRAAALQHRDWLAAASNVDLPDFHLQDVFYTASARRAHLEHRLAIVARSREQLIERLEAFAAEQRASGLWLGRRSPRGRPRIAFVLAGGATEPRVAADLLARWSALQELQARWKQEPHQAAAWPLLVQLAAAQILRAWGITPDVVLGEGAGELAAAHLAGALPLDDALALARRLGNQKPADPAWPLLGAATIPWFSVALGRFWAGPEDSEPWRASLEHTGHLQSAMTAVMARGPKLFIELGRASSDRAGWPEGATVVPGWADGEPMDEVLARVLAAVHVLGFPVDWRSVHGPGARLVRLPSYPWQREPLVERKR